MSFDDLPRGFTCCEFFQNKLNSDSGADNDWFTHHNSWIRCYQILLHVHFCHSYSMEHPHLHANLQHNTTCWGKRKEIRNLGRVPDRVCSNVTTWFLQGTSVPAGRLEPNLSVFRVPTYKFFGPHASALYGRYDLLDQLHAYKVRPADDVPPHKFETGTKNHEGLAGATAAINYLADLGAEFGMPFADQYPGFEGRRLHLKTAIAAIGAYGRPLAERLGCEGIFVRDGNYAESDPDGIITNLGPFRAYLQHHPKIITYMPPRVSSSGSYPRLYVRTVPELNT